MAGAHQHAARARHDREDVAGLDDVRRLGVGDGACTVRARSCAENAGGDAFGGFDGDEAVRRGERLLLSRAICASPSWRQRASSASGRSGRGRSGPEVDDLRRDVLGGDDEVAFVLAVFPSTRMTILPARMSAIIVF